MIGIFSLIGAKMISPNVSKTKVKTRKENADNVLQQVNEEAIDRLSVQLKKESGRANKLQQLRDKEAGVEYEDEPSGQSASWEEIQELIKVSYPQYSSLAPLFKKQILKATKGMSVEDIIKTVQQFVKGSGQSNSATAGIDQTYRADWA